MNKYLVYICLVFAGFNLQAKSQISINNIEEKQSEEATQSYTTMASKKKMNIFVNPLGIIVGSINAGVDIAVSSNFTLGLDGSFRNLSIKDVEVDLLIGGVRASYFFKDVFTDSAYIYGKANYLSGSIKGSPKETGHRVGLGGGYMWMWDNFNIQLGLAAGYTKFDLNIESCALDICNIDSPGVEFKLGYAF